MTIINLLPEDYNANNGFDVDYTLRGLMCNTEYNITIVAFNSRGAGAAFPVPVFTTPLTSELSVTALETVFYASINNSYRTFATT